MIYGWLRKLRERRVRKLLDAYEAQVPPLENLMHRLGLSIFIAPLESIDVGGELRTWTSWTQDVPALLPRADFIGITDRHGRRMLRHWSDVEKLLGRFVKAPRYKPVRLQPPTQFPEGATWAALQRCSGLQGFDYLVATPITRTRKRPT